MFFFLKILWFFWTLKVLLQRWWSTCHLVVRVHTTLENRERPESGIYFKVFEKNTIFNEVDFVCWTYINEYQYSLNIIMKTLLNNNNKGTDSRKTVKSVQILELNTSSLFLWCLPCIPQVRFASSACFSPIFDIKIFDSVQIAELVTSALIRSYGS